MLCGWYHAISFAANGVELDKEDGLLDSRTCSRPDHHCSGAEGAVLERKETMVHC